MTGRKISSAKAFETSSSSAVVDIAKLVGLTGLATDGAVKLEKREYRQKDSLLSGNGAGRFGGDASCLRSAKASSSMVADSP